MSFAIYYNDEAYSVNSTKLMGRNAAGNSFLIGQVKYSSAEAITAYVSSIDQANKFQLQVTQINPDRKIKVAYSNNVDDIMSVGGIYYPGPDIGRLAFNRSFVGNGAWSICGITHTTSSLGAIDSIQELLTSPIQQWDAIICTSSTVKDNVTRILQNYADYLNSRLGLNKLILPMTPVIPLGINTNEFIFTRSDRYRSRADLSVEDDVLVVLYMGRLSFHAKANPLAMYAALEKSVHLSGKKIMLIECGWFANDFIKDSFTDASNVICPNVRVVRLDGRDAINRKAAWSCADIFCSLSDNIQETFGITPIEAMATGLPVVVSDWDGYKDTVRHGIDGFRVPTIFPQSGLGVDLAFRHAVEIDSYDMYCGHSSSLIAVNIEAAVHYLVLLVNSPELRCKMGEAGKSRAVETYDWSVINSQYENLWQNQIETRRSVKDVESIMQLPWSRGMDPFHSFMNYPTITLKLETKLSLLVRKDIAISMLKEYLKLSLLNYASYVFLTLEEMISLINAASTFPQTVSVILDSIDIANKAMSMRALLFLLKINILKVDDDLFSKY